MAQRQANVVKAIDQAVFPERLDLKRQFIAVRFNDHLSLQVDRQGVAGESRRLVKQLAHLALSQHDRQQAILEAVVEEDIGVAGGDNGTKAELIKRPGRMFTRGTTAKILTRQQDRGTLITRLIEDKVRIWLATLWILPGIAGVKVAPFIKQVLAKPGLAD